MRLLGVDGGGTTWKVIITEGTPDNIVEREEFCTEAPRETLARIRSWLKGHKFEAAGIATFGPVCCARGQPKYGYITSTPKPGWQDTDVLLHLGFRDEYKDIPFYFDTDVNAPALAEYKHALHSSPLGSPCISSAVYITVGTGIGVGLVVNGGSVKGLMHPEGGHIRVERLSGDDFAGTCPFHGACLEGMCSTGALAGRSQSRAEDLPQLPDDHPVWDCFCNYMAQLCANLVLLASPERICIGGGVLRRESLLPRIREQTLLLLNGYVQHDLLTQDRIRELITKPTWGNDAGAVGASFLADAAYKDSINPPLS